MKCPVCKTPDLLMTVRSNVEIDYCPTCRGIWLDRGELDKLLNQLDDSREPVRADHSREGAARHGDRGQEWGGRDDSRSDDHRGHYDPRRKKKSLFDMFDFD
jgi:hypothetical protein